MKETSLVIMAAGIGSRFGQGIKQLEKIGPNGEIIMDYSIYDAVKAGFNDVIFIIRKDIEDVFREVIGKRLESRIKVKYCYQEMENIPQGYRLPPKRVKPWGTAQAVLSIKDVINGPFAVINADDYYGRDAFKLIHDYIISHDDSLNMYEYCMAGFILGNTLSDNGAVTRGVCSVGNDGYLKDIVETSGIKKGENETVLHDDNKSDISITLASHVSMNMWGFTESIIKELEDRFPVFLDGISENDIKSEYLLPEVVSELLKEKKARVKVLETSDKWFGVTYKEDAPVVVSAIKRLVNDGFYPEKLV